MRTVGLLTVSWRDLHPGGSASRRGLGRPPSVMWPVMHAGKPPPYPVDRQNTCENITLPQTSFAVSNKISSFNIQLSLNISDILINALHPPIISMNISVLILAVSINFLPCDSSLTAGTVTIFSKQCHRENFTDWYMNLNNWFLFHWERRCDLKCVQVYFPINFSYCVFQDIINVYLLIGSSLGNKC